MLFWSFVGLALIAAFAIAISRGNKKKGKIIDRLIELKFFPSETFVSQWDYSFIALNFETKMIALGRESCISTCEFSQIIQADLLRDDNTITSTTKDSVAARAIVGGVLFGGVGAVVGAVGAGSRSHSSQVPGSISLRVVTENGTFPVLFLRLKSGASRSLDALATQATTEANCFYGSVLKAMRMASAGNSSSLTNSHRAIQSTIASRAAHASTTTASEIEKLWQLKKKGAISLDEFEKAKRSLL
jgi:hypothetical protein